MHEEIPILPSAVTVIIPTFNRAADVQRALRHLFHQTVRDLQVIVVDNSSTDGTAEQIHVLMGEWNGRLRYVRKAPKGPASARNVGLAVATTPFVLFHDSDIELPPDWVERALARMIADPKLGAVGGYILYAFDDMRVNAFGGDMSRLGLAWDVDEGAALDPAQGQATRIWINCSAMLARTEVVRSAGGFDETFFYGYEDSDLGWRINLVGHGVTVFPELRARHHVEVDPGTAHPEIVFHYCKNRLRMILKNASAASLTMILVGYCFYSLADLVWRRPRWAKLRALAWNLSTLGETLRLRREIQARRQQSDAMVFAHGDGRWFPPTPLGGRRRRSVHEGAVGGMKSATRNVADDRV